MARILNFETGAQELPVERKDLRLMLWAGDGEHAGVSDVKRLPNYNVFVCLGCNEKNIADLADDQFICQMNFRDNVQMTEFHRLFDGAFAVIDSDYHGNTPTLPVEEYLRLLAPGGVAHNIVGINSIHMPLEDKLNRLELLAPVLTSEQSYERRWASSVIQLATRDEMPPSFIWKSPDLAHRFYDYVREDQANFERWQKVRNPQWPAHASSLEGHWDTLAPRSLCVNLSRVFIAGDTSVTLLEPHLATLDAYLSARIETLKSPRMILNEEDYTAHMGTEHQASIHILQTILKDMMTNVPEGLTGIVGFHLDERYPDAPKAFGLSLQRLPPLFSTMLPSHPCTVCQEAGHCPELHTPEGSVGARGEDED